jgi:uncharacterized protein YcbX
MDRGIEVADRNLAGTIDAVTTVRIFPVKSCQAATVNGDPITELEVGPTGFRSGAVVDRGWVLVGREGGFVNQRGTDEPQTRHHGDRLLASVTVDIRHDDLHLTSPGHGELLVPLALDGARRRLARAWRCDLVVSEADETAHAFFSELLGRPVRLTKVELDTPRRLPDEFHRDRAANTSAAADGLPMSLASQASLDHLHELAGLPVGRLPLDRFRSNVDIAGTSFGPFGEDRVRRVRIGPMEAWTVMPIIRCTVPNVDQRTGDDSERLATRLLRPRLGWARDVEAVTKAGLFFAQSVNHACEPDGPMTVRVGDPVVAVEVDESNVRLKASAQHSGDVDLDEHLVERE